MAADPLGTFVREYLQRVVNERDVTAVDDLVSPHFRGSGHGWPADLAGLREFYRWQARTRPDWHIDVQETVEVGEWVVVRARAGGTVSEDDGGRPLLAPVFRQVEWLAAYRVVDSRLAEVQFLCAMDRSG